MLLLLKEVNMEKNDVILERLVNARKLKGYKQSDLADLMGVSSKTISRWEQGSSPLKSYQLEKIADILEVNIEYLIGSSDSPIYSLEEFANNLKEQGIKQKDGTILVKKNKEPFLITDYSKLFNPIGYTDLSELEKYIIDVFDSVSMRFKREMLINLIPLIKDKESMSQIADWIRNSEKQFQLEMEYLSETYKTQKPRQNDGEGKD